MRRLNVLHVITHLAVGGATENTLTTCRLGSDRVNSLVLHGPTSAQEDNLEQVADDAGIARHLLPSLRRDPDLKNDGPAYRDLVKFMKSRQWDVVHTHTSKAGILGRLAAKKAQIPVIVHTVHGWGHHEHMNPLKRNLIIAAEKWAMRATDKMIVVADAGRDRGVADGIGKPENYVTINSGIDLPRYQNVVADKSALRREMGIPDDALVVGTVSRLAPQKAPEDFVTMAAAIHKIRPDVHFVFVGGGPLQAEFSAAIQAAGLRRVMHDLGYRSDVPQLLRTFDVFALTSLWEGLPRVFAQAMCAGLPIVATRVDGAPEAVFDGENGFLVNPKEPVVQANRVLELLADPERARRMGERGRQIVDPKFSDRAMVTRIEDVYFEIARAKNLSLGDDAPKADAV